MESYWGDLREVFEKQPSPIICYTPAAIFANKVPALDINFLNPGSNFEEQYTYLLSYADYPSADDQEYSKLLSEVYGITNTEEQKDLWYLGQIVKDIANSPAGSTERRNKVMQILNGKTIKDQNGEDVDVSSLANSAVIISPIVSKWYVALRNIAVVGLLIVLLYIGIRILISSASEELAKYKTMLKDWAMAMLLVFLIHYLMLGLLTVTQDLSTAMGKAVYTQIQGGSSNQNGGNNNQGSTSLVEDEFFRVVRLKESQNRNAQEDEETGYLDKFGYALMYLILVIYTVMFTFKYLRRLVYMAFLTVISPMVALTYPIDKMNGKAQAFDYWFKEYLFNLLIQIIHLMLYVVLVGAAIDFAESNIIYGIIALSFIMEAEGFIRNMFGVKGEGGGLAPSAFTAGALFSQGLNLIDRATRSTKRLISKSSNSKNGNDGGNDSSIRQQEIKDDSANASVKSFDSGRNNNNSSSDDNSNTPLSLNSSGSSNDSDDSDNSENSGNSEGSDDEESNQKLFGDKDESIGDTSRFSEDEDDEEADKILNGTDGEDDDEDTKSIEGDNNKNDNNSEPEQLNGSANTAQIAGNSQPSKKKGRSVIRGIKRAAGRYFNKDNYKKLAVGAAKFGVRNALGLAGAATLGTMGLAAGLASGEGLKGALKYAGLGAASGGALGRATGNLGMRAITGARTMGKRFTGDFKKGYYSKQEYTRKQNEKIEKAFMNSSENKEFFQSKFEGEDVREKMQQALAIKRYGINDNESLAKAVKLQDKNDLTAQQAATVAKLGSITSLEDFTDPERLANLSKIISSQLPKKEDQAKFMKLLGDYHDVEKKTGIDVGKLLGTGNGNQNNNQT